MKTLHRLAGLFLLLALAPALRAQDFAGLYYPTDAELEHITARGWEAFQAEHQQQNAAGFRLLDLETNWVEGDRVFHGIFTKSPLEDAVKRAAGWDNFIKLKRKMVDEGFTMIDVAAIAKNESDYDFFGVWVKQDPAIVHKVWLLNVEDINTHTIDMARDRFKIKRVHVLPVPNGEPRFVVLYHFSAVDRYNFLYITKDLEAFNKEVKERKESKVELIDYARYLQGNEIHYLGVFQDGEYESAFLPEIEADKLRMTSDSIQASSGLKLINLSTN